MMRAILLFVVLALLLPVEVARADKPAPPTTYQKVCSDGRFVFVMHSPDSLETELGRFNPEFAQKIKAIRTRYPKSGLYKNDNSNELLWTVDWYRSSVAVPSDGIHLVRFGNWPFLRQARTQPPDAKALKQEALSFFARGKLLKSYSIGEVVDQPQDLPRTVSHFRWLKDSRFLDRDQQFEVITYDGNRIRFDLATGKVLEKTRIKPKG
jgi:hypothetical protein